MYVAITMCNKIDFRYYATYFEKAVACIYLHVYVHIVIRDRAGQYCNFSAWYYLEKYRNNTINHEFYKCLSVDLSIRVFQSFAMISILDLQVL